MGFTSWIKLQFLRMYTTHFWKWGRFVAWLIDSSQRGNYPVAVRVLTRDTRAALHWNEMVMAIPSNPAMSWKIAQHILNELRYSKNLRIFHGVDMCLPPKYRVFPWLLKKKKSGILQLRDRGRDGVMIIFRPQTEAHQNGQVVIGTLWFLEHGWKIHSKNLHSVRMFNCHVWLPEGTFFFLNPQRLELPLYENDI